MKGQISEGQNVSHDFNYHKCATQWQPKYLVPGNKAAGTHAFWLPLYNVVQIFGLLVQCHCYQIIMMVIVFVCGSSEFLSEMI